MIDSQSLELLKSLLLTFLTAGLIGLVNKYSPVKRVFTQKAEQEKAEVFPVEEKISTAEREKLQHDLTQIAIDQVNDLNEHLKNCREVSQRLQDSLDTALRQNSELDKIVREYRTKAEKAEAELNRLSEGPPDDTVPL